MGMETTRIDGRCWVVGCRQAVDHILGCYCKDHGLQDHGPRTELNELRERVKLLEKELDNMKDEQQLTKRQRAIVDLMWDSMKKDHDYPDRVRTTYGTKTKLGLALTVEHIYEENTILEKN